MKRINAEDFRDLMQRVTYCPFITDMDVCSKAGIRNQSQYSRFKYENNPNVKNQERIIKGILYAIDEKIIALDASEIEQCRKIIDQCVKYLLSGAEDEAEMYHDMFAEYNFNYLNIADKEWEILSKFPHAQIKWLDLYYDTIDSNFRMDLEYIKLNKYPSDFKPKKSSSIDIDHLIANPGLKKTLNCIFFGKFSAKKYADNYQNLVLSDEELNQIRKRFIKRITKYHTDFNSGSFYLPHDDYLQTLISQNDVDMEEYLPTYNFINYINLILSITTKEWLTYGKYRLFLIENKGLN